MLVLLFTASLRRSPSFSSSQTFSFSPIAHRGCLLWWGCCCFSSLLKGCSLRRLLPPFSLLIAQLQGQIAIHPYHTIRDSFPFSFLFNLPPFLDFPSCNEAPVSGCCASHGHGLRAGGSSSSCQPPNRAKAPPNLPLTSSPNTQPAPTHHHLLPSFFLSLFLQQQEVAQQLTVSTGSSQQASSSSSEA